ncbi:MAG TPA: hypothetical protein VHR16_10670 [Candidatus Limnocylindrales bacterium]|jgi:hypothetical protein|nr:hypothetical protein [Candidatus Limnocylindrales bacterium]
MTMHRRPVGRTRLLAAIGGLATLAGCFLPWWTRGGGPDELTKLSGTAFEGMGIVVFAAAIATLALVTLPYATERPVSVDRWSSYALIAGLGWLAFLYRIVELWSVNAFSFAEPKDVITNIPGLWLSGIGLAIIARATYQMLGEPRLR